MSDLLLFLQQNLSWAGARRSLLLSVREPPLDPSSAIFSVAFGPRLDMPPGMQPGLTAISAIRLARRCYEPSPVGLLACYLGIRAC
jgi:hypothetical protein